jgi:hypothetical protein
VVTTVVEARVMAVHRARVRADDVRVGWSMILILCIAVVHFVNNIS